jgi:hypothetical protein
VEGRQYNMEPVTWHLSIVMLTGCGMMWMHGIEHTKHLFSGQDGPQKRFGRVSDTFLLFVYEEIVTLIVQETNKYAERFIQVCTLKWRLCDRNWEPVTGWNLHWSIPHTLERSFWNQAIHTPNSSQVWNKDIWTSWIFHWVPVAPHCL